MKTKEDKIIYSIYREKVMYYIARKEIVKNRNEIKKAYDDTNDKPYKDTIEELLYYGLIIKESKGYRLNKKNVISRVYTIPTIRKILKDNNFFTSEIVSGHPEEMQTKMLNLARNDPNLAEEIKNDKELMNLFNEGILKTQHPNDFKKA